MINKFLNKFLGDQNAKRIEKIRKRIPEINQHQESFSSLDEAGVKAKTEEFKQRLKDGETTDDLLAEAFGLVKHACTLLNGQTFEVAGGHATWNMIPYDVQLVGGMVLHSGKIAEMKTGEGKTLVATLPLYLNALEGKGAFLVTVNDYLAQRDAEWMGNLYRLLGLSVGVIHHGQTPSEKKEAYACDITYGTNNEFGFDYLRDNMSTDLENCVQRELHYAIVDEVDSILIDEARTPLIISAPAEESTDKYIKYSRLVPQLEAETHYTIDEKGRSAILTDDGVKKMEELLGIENIYTESGAAEVHHIEQALKAYAIFKKDVDYLINDGQVVIIDEFTGRPMAGRRYSEGLHQAIEAKERVEIKRESRTLATITFQNFFRLFDKLSGMTGTAETEDEEFATIYGLETMVIPTNKPVIRDDRNDLVYKSLLGKFQAVTKHVKELQEKGQPVLVGTVSVEKSEVLSQMFHQAGVQHEVLNAKHNAREAEIVADAGRKGAVTIATNMAGRGTDIKVNQEVKDLGGLVIIGTERHESRRIDNQLRGRSGRQGDPGMSQFYVSMEDELMRLFGGDRMISIMETLKVPEDMPIENGLISRSIESAQKKVEGRNFDIRKHLVEYDDVMNKHRTIVYKRRREILENENIHDQIIELTQKLSRQLSLNFLSAKNHQEWQKNDFYEALHSYTGAPVSQLENMFEQDTERESIEQKTEKLFMDLLEKKQEPLDKPETFYNVEKQVYLRTIDRLWMEHIDTMMKLREQVSFRGYAQKDPLIEYKNEGFSLFEKLISSVQTNTIQTLLRMEIKVRIPREEVKTTTNEEEISDIETGDREFLPGQKPVTNSPKVVSADEPSTPVNVYRAQPTSNPSVIRVSANNDEPEEEEKYDGESVGRNDPCPCGSGKKFKKCHGK